MAKYNNQAARSQEQLEKMKELAARGVCAFCPENIHEAEGKIVFETQEWIVKYNGYPYEGTKLHLILIPTMHVKTVSELPAAIRAEFLNVVEQCEKWFDLKSYALAMRAGDMRYNGGSVEHIHAHIVVGDTNDPKHQPVRFKMSNRPD